MKKFLPFIPVLLCAIWALTTLIPRKPASQFDIAAFGRLPVFADGRMKPLDTVARATLLRIQGNQTVRAPDGRAVTPTEWLLDTIFNPTAARQYRVFQITHSEVLTLVQLTPDDGDGKKRFSAAQLAPHLDDIERQARLAGSVDASQRNSYQRAILDLYDSLTDYQGLQYSFILPESNDFLGDLTRLNAALAQPADGRAVSPKPPSANALLVPNGGALGEHALPDAASTTQLLADARARFQVMSTYSSNTLLTLPPTSTQPTWLKTGDALTAALDAFTSTSASTSASPSASVSVSASASALQPFSPSALSPTLPPAALAYAGLARAWQANQPAQFNEILRTWQQQIAKLLPSGALGKTNAECRFNAAQPFITAMVLCVLAFLIGVAAWLKWPGALGRSSLWMLGLAWLLMAAGIATRMWLEGRPPVTNLYSSALGVGMFAVALCIIIEAIFKTNLVNVAGSLLGFGTLIIAHHLSFSGDTMEAMRAVLDSNFWLTTHVLAITVGYAATFVSGIIAIIVILYRLVSPAFDSKTFALLERIVYGVVCFALLFSFLGTVLGGIWADQSWGRFWGWDPKENGALIIVIWNAVVLHARWGKFTGPTGIMAMAVFGNIVTAWSWFGVNQLGVGLHSYGFTSGSTLALTIFYASNLIVIALALLPERRLEKK